MTNYELLGLGENATEEEIAAAYKALKAKYSEERWQEGEAGSHAARMLEKIDVAYEEIMRERRETSRDAEGKNAFDDVADLIRAGDLAGAQEKLDAFNERPAEWHYLQSVVFYKKNWINESKKQLEIAIQLDGANAKYKEAYEKLRARANYREQTGGAENVNPNPIPEEQMGGNTCANCANICYSIMCVNCLFNFCCSCCR